MTKLQRNLTLNLYQFYRDYGPVSCTPLIFLSDTLLTDHAGAMRDVTQSEIILLLNNTFDLA